MAMKLTRKSVKETYPIIIEVGYCQLQSLLSCVDRIGYTSGIYGWNADVLRVSETVCIVTGYRPFGNRYPSNELLKRYETEAEKIKNRNWYWYETETQLHNLLMDFVGDAITE